MAHDVFVGYSSKDKPTADAVSATLEAAGIRCWIAPRDIAPGADWGESIVTAIEGARMMVLVFSAHANTSVQIKREVERAVHKGLVIIPLRIEDVLPAKSLEYFLSTPHWLDAFTPPLERHLRYLAGVVRQILEGGAAVHPAPPPPLPLHRRRGVLRAGAASVAVLVALGAWLLLRPVPPPSFIGKWRARKVTLDINEGGNISTVGELLQAALAGPKLAAAFDVAPDGQYSYGLAAEDYGTVSETGASCRAANEVCGKLTFTSALTRKPVLLGYELSSWRTQYGTIDGGKPGDLSMTLRSQLWWINLYGQPTDGVFGHWHGQLRNYCSDYSFDFEIAASGSYRLRISHSEHGLFRAENGDWNRTPSGGCPTSGRYLFDGADRVTMTWERGAADWERAR